mmetsp:Transcript_38063/g.45988  ORF Transcript_38063/g.45988 Transcript_38063/m.45988 type:complete len:347 (+) Transcript_38063:106-1146(+)
MGIKMDSINMTTYQSMCGDISVKSHNEQQDKHENCMLKKRETVSVPLNFAWALIDGYDQEEGRKTRQKSHRSKLFGRKMLHLDHDEIQNVTSQANVKNSIKDFQVAPLLIVTPSPKQRQQKEENKSNIKNTPHEKNERAFFFVDPKQAYKGKAISEHSDRFKWWCPGKNDNCTTSQRQGFNKKCASPIRKTKREINSSTATMPCFIFGDRRVEQKMSFEDGKNDFPQRNQGNNGSTEKPIQSKQNHEKLSNVRKPSNRRSDKIHDENTTIPQEYRTNRIHEKKENEEKKWESTSEITGRKLFEKENICIVGKNPSRSPRIQRKKTCERLRGKQAFSNQRHNGSAAF